MDTAIAHYNVVTSDRFRRRPACKDATAIGIAIVLSMIALLVGTHHIGFTDPAAGAPIVRAGLPDALMSLLVLPLAMTTIAVGTARRRGAAFRS